MARVITRSAFPAAVAALLLAAAALRLPSLFEPRWYGDEGIFAAIAQNLREGRVLYAEAWDNKPPLIYYTYAAIQALFGTGVMPLHAVASAAVLATLGGVIALAARLYGRPHALVAGAIFAVLMCTPVLEGNLALTETFMAPPVTLAVLLLAFAPAHAGAGRLAAAGVMLGVAAGYKQVAVFDALAVAFMLWLTHPRPAAAVAGVAAGFAVPQAALVLLAAATGALGEYRYAVVGSLPLYADLAPALNPLERFATYVPALVVAGWLAHRRAAGDTLTMADFPLLWFGFAVAGATASAFPFPHYLQQVSAAAALVAVSAPWRGAADAPARVALATAGVAALVVLAVQFQEGYAGRQQIRPADYYETFADRYFGELPERQYTYYFDGKADAVDDIVAHIEADAAGDSVFVWGELPWIWPAAGLRNPSRYYTSFLGELIPGARDEIMDDLRDDPPVYVLISDSAYAPFPTLEAFVNARYQLLRAENDWRLYRLSGAQGRLAPIAVAQGRR